MDTTKINSEQLHEEAANTQTLNHGGETMGEQPRQDQQSAGQNSETKTRKPYDGSKGHGIVVKNISDVEMAAKAKARLVLRLAYLNNEFDKCVSIIQDPAKSISDKIPAVKASEKINEDLKKLQEVADELRAKVPQLEELAKGRVENFDPSVKMEVTI